MAFSPSFTCKNTPYKSRTTSLTYVSSQARRRNKHIPSVKVVIPSNPIFGTTNSVRKCISHQKKPEMKCKSAEKSDFSLEINRGSVSDVIDIFRVCINNKNNTRELEGLISSDCCIKDSVNLSYVPDENKQGKQNVMQLLKNLAEKIDKQELHFKFEVNNICEEDLTAFVNWKLVHNESQDIKHEGSCVVQCSNEGGKLVIRELENIILCSVSISGDKTQQEPSSSPEQS